MTRKTKKALLASIEHWHQILDMLILNWLSNSPLTLSIEIGRLSCPLCLLFNNKGSIDGCCIGCPIFQRTHKTWCTRTPYTAVDQWKRKHFPLSSTYRPPSQKDYEIGYELISNELEFLYSLLPE